MLMLEVARLQGLIEIGSVSEQDRTIHRILTPILKLYTAKQVHFTHVCVLQGTVVCIRLLIVSRRSQL